MVALYTLFDKKIMFNSIQLAIIYIVVVFYWLSTRMTGCGLVNIMGKYDFSPELKSEE